MRDARRRVRWFWQRRTRGFDDTVLWSLDYHITKFILPRLKAFAENPRISYSTDTPEEWQRILDEMVWAFQFMADHESGWGGTPEELKRMRAGLKLFAKWYGALWD